MNCGRETKTDFYKRTCILGQCDNLKNYDLKNYLPNVQAKNVHYYVFEKVETQYYNMSETGFLYIYIFFSISKNLHYTNKQIQINLLKV